MIKRFLIWLVKKKVITAPKQHIYAVELQVMLDGKIIKRFPVEVLATGRRAAKFEVTRRLAFKTATTAKKIDLINNR